MCKETEFIKEFKTLSFTDDKNLPKAVEFFNKVNDFIEKSTDEKYVHSITDSNSIYFRFHIKDFEVHAEAFFTKDTPEDEIEVVYSIYKNEELFVNNFGTLESMFDTINITITDGIK